MVKIPYSEIELKIALLGIDEAKFKEIGEELKKELETIGPNNQAELNQKTAEYHGITLETLINSPNYGKLCEKYQEYVFEIIIKKLTNSPGLTKKQAWGVVAAGLGLLD